MPLQRTFAHEPRSVPQVMVSSTFMDLIEHRKALIDAIESYGLHANVMESHSARLADLIDSSLQMVRDSAAYIGVVGLRYGQTPECPTRNPDNLSITELEFNEAQRLGRPILLFVMDDDHLVRKGDIEKDEDKERKLQAFRQRAMKSAPHSNVNRVYAVFSSLEAFKEQLGTSLAELKAHLDTRIRDEPEGGIAMAYDAAIPRPPSLFAKPDYIGSHDFVGRAAELQAITDWAKPADLTSLLLLEAIGGSGKSMLTWEWTTNPVHALAARPTDDPWAGRFWYSFYERGAIMADFCHHALAYMTGRPHEEFAQSKTAELKDELLAQLHARPWLLILDGLERVLVAYHRIDAAEVRDDEADDPKDVIADRRPTDTIREEDTELLRALAAAAPSKLLVTSRLIPRVLLNPSGQPIPGAKCMALAGLRPSDAEQLLRSCGIDGTSQAIQDYLADNCGNHPLVIGILGGLIINYLPARGDFDAWSSAADGGAALDLSTLDLIQRRNHILRAALDALPHASRQVLSTVTLLADSVDYDTLEALNPHLPPEPKEVVLPEAHEEALNGDETSSDRGRSGRTKDHEATTTSWFDLEEAVRNRLTSEEFRAAQRKLEAAVIDLEQRGLLQWDNRDRKYDLHPVVRGVASGAMSVPDLKRHGQRVVDYFTAQPHRPYEQAQTLEDLRTGLHVVRTLIKLGRLQEAADNYVGVLCLPLLKMEHYAEVIAVSRPFFVNGWATIPSGISHWQGTHLLQDAAMAFIGAGDADTAFECEAALLMDALRRDAWDDLASSLESLATSRASSGNPIAREERLLGYGLRVAELGDSELWVYRLLLSQASFLSRVGRYAEADSTWERLRRLKVSSFDVHGTIEAATEHELALHMMRQQCLTLEIIVAAEQAAERAVYRAKMRGLHRLRGCFWLESGEWALAAASFEEAVRMARERSLTDEVSEAGLTLAKHNLGQLPSPLAEAERLSHLREPAHHTLATLWLSVGIPEQAKRHALEGYRWAWADGEPYVRRYELGKFVELLQQLDVPIPDLPRYDPSGDEVFHWEDAVRAAIEKRRARSRSSVRTTDSSGATTEPERSPTGE